MAIITITPDGQAVVVGIQLTADTTIAPGEAAVVIPVEDLAAFLEELVAGSADGDERWDFMELLRQRGTGEAA